MSAPEVTVSITYDDYLAENLGETECWQVTIKIPTATFMGKMSHRDVDLEAHYATPGQALDAAILWGTQRGYVLNQMHIPDLRLIHRDEIKRRTDAMLERAAEAHAQEGSKPNMLIPPEDR